MLGGVIILIIYTALTLGWVVVALTTMARVRVCSTSLVTMDGAVPLFVPLRAFCWVVAKQHSKFNKLKAKEYEKHILFL